MKNSNKGPVVGILRNSLIRKREKQIIFKTLKRWEIFQFQLSYRVDRIYGSQITYKWHKRLLKLKYANYLPQKEAKKPFSSKFSMKPEKHPNNPTDDILKQQQ